MSNFSFKEYVAQKKAKLPKKFGNIRLKNPVSVDEKNHVNTHPVILNAPTDNTPKITKWQKFKFWVKEHEQELVNYAHTAKDVLEIWASVNYGSKWNIGLGLFSTYGAIREMQQDYDYAVRFCHKKGLTQVRSNIIKELTFSLTKELNLELKQVYPKTSIKLLKTMSKQPDEIVEVLTLNNEEFYFIRETRSVLPNQLYVYDLDKAKAALAKFVLDVMGNFIALVPKKAESHNNPGDYETLMGLQKDFAPSNKLIGAMNEEYFYNKWKMFADKGFGRPILFVGNPGTGKSCVARRLAQKMNGLVLVIQPNTYASVPEEAIFEVIQLLQPDVLLFDDLDRIEGNMLSVIEQANIWANQNKKVIIATANNLERIDYALRRPGRFDEVIFFELPNEQLRYQILEYYIEKFGGKKNKQALTKWAAASEGLSPAYLMEIARRIVVLGNQDLNNDITIMRRLIGDAGATDE